MIRSNLAVMMAKRKIRSITELASKIGVSRNSLTKLYHGTGKAVRFDTLTAVCSYFDCNVGDLLEHVKEA